MSAMRFSKALPMLEIFNLGCLIAPSSSSNSPLPFGRSSIGTFGASRKATGPSRTVPCVALTNEAIDVCRPAPTRYIAVRDLVDGRSGPQGRYCLCFGGRPFLRLSCCLKTHVMS